MTRKSTGKKRRSKRREYSEELKAKGDSQNSVCIVSHSDSAFPTNLQ